MSLLIQENVSLAKYVTLKTGGLARYFIEVISDEDLKKAVYFAQQNKLPFFVLGGGSNVLVSDEGFEGVVIKMNIKGREYSSLDSSGQIILSVGAGENLDNVISETVSKGLWGLENLSHIPGTVGATPVQNVGAYGVEVSNIISAVKIFDTETEKVLELKNSDCVFSYRHSIFKEKNNLIVLSVNFILSRNKNSKLTYADLSKLENDNLTPQIVRDEIISVRSDKFPDWSTVGTAGSFFKNPIITTSDAEQLLLKYPDIPTYSAGNGYVKVGAGFILDKICGLKGFAKDGVRLYEKQALVLVVDAGATSTDVKNFAKYISQIVFEKTLIRIEQEVFEL